MNLNNFERFRTLTEKMGPLTRETMEPFLLEEEEKTGLKEYYSAHTDYMDPEARIVFIGICPGFEQMKLSFDIVQQQAGQPALEVLRNAKCQARFGRSMRKNLIALADRTILPERLGIRSCQELFEPDCRLMDNTCLLPYPVFRHGKNYTGHAPKISRSALLEGICLQQLKKIAAAYPRALFIPLGRCVDEQVSQTKILPSERIVHGFPHPSGANGHRWHQLEENLVSINEAIAAGLPTDF